MRKFASILFLCAAIFSSLATPTNYFCVVCGKGPLHGQVWMSKWGAICDDCYKLENHCSICGLPIRDGDGAIKTGDGRYICKFDKKNAVLDNDAAKEIFNDARQELIGLFGEQFALNFPDVTVNLFDVDYWSEKGREDGLHKFGFSHTRKTKSGACTHEVVMLSGRLKMELAATSAHEYTHLWINENRLADRVIDQNTIEAICELSAYKLMQSRGQTNQMQRILENPYTHGEIKKLVEVENENGESYILNWVKNGTSPSFETETAARVAPLRTEFYFTNVVAPLPEALKLDGLLFDPKNSHAIVSGVSLAAGETKKINLRGRTINVLCKKIGRDEVVLEADGNLLTLKIGDENFLP